MDLKWRRVTSLFYDAPTKGRRGILETIIHKPRQVYRSSSSARAPSRGVNGTDSWIRTSILSIIGRLLHQLSYIRIESALIVEQERYKFVNYLHGPLRPQVYRLIRKGIL